MKTLTIFLLCSFLFAACTPSASPQITAQNNVEEISTDQLEPVKETNASGAMLEFKGEFFSTKGIMDPLSCYCYNSGYIRSGTEKIAACFDKGEMEVECKKIQVKGQYKSISIDPGPMSPCPAGTKQVLIIKSFDCL